MTRKLRWEKTIMRNCVILSDIYTLGVDKQAQIFSQLNRKYDWAI